MYFPSNSWLFVAAFFIGFIASIFGLGGGFVIVPTLLFAGLSTQMAVGTSIAATEIIGVSSLMCYMKEGHIDRKLTYMMVMMTVPAAILGSFVTSFVSSDDLAAIFGTILVLLALTMWMKRPQEFEHHRYCLRRHMVGLNGHATDYEINMALIVPASISAGFFAGIAGISGGVFMLPVMIRCGVPVKYAVGTSSMMVTLTALAAFLAHFYMGNINYLALLLMAPALYMGAHLGPRLGERVTGKQIRHYFSIILLLTAAVTLYRFA
jgi:uncharacterized membrane protein YfcA